jgi:SAM-dependent methyltransferase
MDRARYSLLAHSNCAFAAPVHPDAFRDLVDTLHLPERARVLDLGCGKAELSALIAEKWGAQVFGIDCSSYALDQARARARTLTRGSLTVIEGDIGGALPAGPWDLVVNIGAMPPGQQVAAVRAWATALAPGGEIVIGDGFWKRAPEPGYLDVLGATAADMLDLPGALGLAASAGLVSTRSRVSPDADFEAYEVAYRTNIERHVAAHPDDVDADAMLARAASWWGVYERWGRATLGFVVLGMSKGR